jgi:para-aminobenzoate synthetase/4-amino-4-deoxychorismate lyase
MWGGVRQNQGLGTGPLTMALQPMQPVVFLDGGQGTSLRFGTPRAVIRACQAADVPGALEALEAALAEGWHVAGWFAYELGYVLEPRLRGLERTTGDLPLLWFGVFGPPERIGRADLHAKGRAYAGPLHPEWDREAYTERFDRVHDYIGAGDIYQANLSFRARFAFAGDPFALYLGLRDAARASHGGYVDAGEWQVLSLSPEQFFEISPQGKITARPMKGTAPRGADQLTDARAKAALATSAKERAENLMIVDLVRNDIGRLALIGSVAVGNLFEVETYPTLHTMVSTVTAQLKPATRVRQIVRALFPCGSVTGAPKIRAMEIIRELETSARGIYCGALGYFAPDGSADFNVAIRTVLVRSGRGELGIGGAVVQDSNATSEYDECLLKARYFDSGRQPIGLIETLRHDDGFLRLPLHLDRMQSSARLLSLPFDRAAAEARLRDAVANHSGQLRVRLALDEQGGFTCTVAPLGPLPERWTYGLSPHRVDSGDLLLRHKTTWRQMFDAEQARLAKACGADEVIFLNERGELTEGSRSTIFFRRGRRLVTPPLSSGLLDGVLRRELFESGACCEGVLTPEDLATGELFLGNSLRGLIPAQPVARALD